MNLGYRRQLTPKVALVGTATDLFEGQRFERIVTTPTLRDDYRRRRIGRVTYLGLVYAFGGGKKADKFDYDR